MPGYLEGYGAGEARRERRLLVAIVSVLGMALAGTIGYYSFRDYSHDRKMKDFVAAVQRQDLPAAYTFWGCSQQTPCRDYNFEKFLEDWGPKGANVKFAGGRWTDAERCGTGYLAALANGNERVTLWVERSTGILSYSPWEACPERKLRVVKWLRMKFGGG